MPQWNAVQWQTFVRQELLPAINVALRSTTFVVYELRGFTVAGMRSGVKILGRDRMPVWTAFVLQGLGEPAYASYTVEFRGVWGGGGAHWRSGVPTPPHIVTLNKYRASEEAAAFTRQHLTGHLEIVITR